MTKTPEEKATVRKNRTVQTNSKKTNLTPEEKAREYADGMLNVYESNIDKSSRNIQYFNAYELMDAYIDGYHSRDEEVKELIEALKEVVDTLQERCDKYGMSPTEHEVLAKAKQLIKE